MTTTEYHFDAATHPSGPPGPVGAHAEILTPPLVDAAGGLQLDAASWMGGRT